MKKYFIVAALLFSGAIMPEFSAYAQSQSTEAKYKNGSKALSDFIGKKFGQEAKKYDLDVCSISGFFVKFTIDSVGNIGVLSFSDTKHIPQVFRTVVSSAILATSGSWIPATINGKPTQSKPFILPVVYAMEAGCNPRNLPPPGGKYIHKEIPNGLEAALLYILNFEDNVGGDNTQLECILLKPLYVFSQN